MSVQGMDVHEETADDGDRQMPLDTPFIIGAGHLLRILDRNKTTVILAERCVNMLREYARENERLRKQLADLAKQALLDMMCNFSEECYRAGWMDGLEISLWKIVQARGGHYGQGVITGREAEKLKELSALCGGWWHWPKGADCPQFITIKEWEQRGEG